MSTTPGISRASWQKTTEEHHETALLPTSRLHLLSAAAAFRGGLGRNHPAGSCREGEISQAGKEDLPHRPPDHDHRIEGCHHRRQRRHAADEPQGSHFQNRGLHQLHHPQSDARFRPDDFHAGEDHPDFRGRQNHRIRGGEGISGSGSGPDRQRESRSLPAGRHTPHRSGAPLRETGDSHAAPRQDAGPAVRNRPAPPRRPHSDRAALRQRHPDRRRAGTYVRKSHHPRQRLFRHRHALQRRR